MRVTEGSRALLFGCLSQTETLFLCWRQGDNLNSKNNTGRIRGWRCQSTTTILLQLVGKGKWMNNGKVRIYDLSKELNLDNKELLAICQLNISVKTIAAPSPKARQNGRAAAEKQAASLPSSRGIRCLKQGSLTSATGVRPKPSLPTNSKFWRFVNLKL